MAIDVLQTQEPWFDKNVKFHYLLHPEGKDFFKEVPEKVNGEIFRRSLTQSNLKDLF